MSPSRKTTRSPSPSHTNKRKQSRLKNATPCLGCSLSKVRCVTDNQGGPGSGCVRCAKQGKECMKHVPYSQRAPYIQEFRQGKNQLSPPLSPPVVSARYLPEVPITQPGEPDPYDQFHPANTYSDYSMQFIYGFVPTGTDVSYVTQMWDPFSQFSCYTDLTTALDDRHAYSGSYANAISTSPQFLPGYDNTYGSLSTHTPSPPYSGSLAIPTGNLSS